MSELLELVLNDPAARDAAGLPSVAAQAADTFLPWSSLDEA
jgi:hypothetical protein